jgi:hypothetical protein
LQNRLREIADLDAQIAQLQNEQRQHDAKHHSDVPALGVTTHIPPLFFSYTYTHTLSLSFSLWKIRSVTIVLLMLLMFSFLIHPWHDV